jgi:radical SAM superfamily enzyme YgiQ (UPF0313 family)
MMVTRVFREIYPNSLIVVGGYHPTALPEDFMTPDNVIDYVVKGEGELAMKDIADGLSTRGRPPCTQVVQGATVMPEDFVEPRWDLVEELVRAHYPDGMGNIYLYLSRGCPFGCSFCMEPLKDRRWRAYDPTRALDIMDEAVGRFRSYAVAICDACFGMRPSWRKAFLRGAAARKLPYWLLLETRPEYLDEEDIDLLADLRVEVEFGVESGSPAMLKLMNKTKRPERFLQRFSETSRLMSSRGVLHRANLIFNHPGETKATMAETFAYMDDMLSVSDSCLMWACAQYMHFPGCDLDIRRSYYEETFGTRFDSPRWWQEDDDQYVSCHRSLPSSDFRQEDVDLWRRMFAERMPRLRESLSPKAFKFASMKYYPDWQDGRNVPQS